MNKTNGKLRIKLSTLYIHIKLYFMYFYCYVYVFLLYAYVPSSCQVAIFGYPD